MKRKKAQFFVIPAKNVPISSFRTISRAIMKIGGFRDDILGNDGVPVIKPTAGVLVTGSPQTVNIFKQMGILGIRKATRTPR